MAWLEVDIDVATRDDLVIAIENYMHFMDEPHAQGHRVDGIRRRLGVVLDALKDL